MKKVVILGKNFNKLCGAVDFLRMLIKGLVRNQEYIFYFLVPVEEENEIENSKKYFIEFEKELKIIPYFEKDLDKTLKEINPDVIIPACEKLKYPNVGYLYDCQHKYYPENFVKEDIKIRDNYFMEIIDSKFSIIVNSLDAKNDLIKFYNAGEEKIYNLPFCPILNKNHLEPLGYDVLQKYEIPKKYFIVSNQFWAHKSHITAFEAISTLKQRGHNDICLVCTGTMKEPRNPEYIDKLISKIKKWGIEDNIKLLGFIDKREQVELLKNAISVIQPTLFEGGPGGGSIYDAIALGQRAILTDIRINLELINEPGLKYFKAKNAVDLANKMEEDLKTEFIRASNDILIQNELKRLDKLTLRLNEALKKANADDFNARQTKIISLFGLITFLRIKIRPNWRKIYLLGFIPFVEITNTSSVIKVKLFNFIPIRQKRFLVF